MIPNMPTVGVRFDIAKLQSDDRATECWRLFWQAVDPPVIGGSLLFDGEGSGNVFFIVIQSMDGAVLKAVEEGLRVSEGYRAVSAEPMLVKGDEVTSEPLQAAGNVDAGGMISGEAGASLEALKAVRPERAEKPEPPPGAVPATQARRGFARSTTIGSHAARAALTGDGFGSAPARKPTTKSKKPGTVAVRQHDDGSGKTILFVIMVIAALALIVVLLLLPSPTEAPEEELGAVGQEEPLESEAPAAEVATEVEETPEGTLEETAEETTEEAEKATEEPGESEKPDEEPAPETPAKEDAAPE